MTMKNWYGLLGNPRNQFPPEHPRDHLRLPALMMKPSFVIADWAETADALTARPVAA